MTERENNIRHIWLAVLSYIRERLGNVADTFLADVEIELDNMRLTIITGNAWYTDIIRRRLVDPYIIDALHEQGLNDITVEIRTKTATLDTAQDDDPLLVRQILQTLGPDFDFLGIVDIHEGTFVVLKTAFEEGGEKNGIMMFEIDTTEQEISKYSFAVVDDDTIPMVFHAYCKKYGPKTNK